MTGRHHGLGRLVPGLGTLLMIHGGLLVVSGLLVFCALRGVQRTDEARGFVVGAMLLVGAVNTGVGVWHLVAGSALRRRERRRLALWALWATVLTAVNLSCCAISLAVATYGLFVLLGPDGKQGFFDEGEGGRDGAI